MEIEKNRNTTVVEVNEGSYSLRSIVAMLGSAGAFVSLLGTALPVFTENVMKKGKMTEVPFSMLGLPQFQTSVILVILLAAIYVVLMLKKMALPSLIIGLGSLAAGYFASRSVMELSADKTALYGKAVSAGTAQYPLIGGPVVMILFAAILILMNRNRK